MADREKASSASSCRIHGGCSRDIISFHPPGSPYGPHHHPNFVDDELGPECRKWGSLNPRSLD